MSRVLLVDDDADALEIRKRIFENHGHHVTTAQDANLALEQFRAEPPESVILDLRLPGAEDGIALIREFRAASQHLRIVVLSGCCADLDGRSERSLVNVLLQKPVRSEVLLGAVGQVPDLPSSSTNNRSDPPSSSTPENTPATPRASSQETESFAPQAAAQAARK
jgi:DNA-binding response OmpR family regulator